MLLIRCLCCYRNNFLVLKSFNAYSSFSRYSYVRKRSLHSLDKSSLFNMHFNMLRILNCRHLHNTVKGWKFMAKPRIIENDEDKEFDPADIPCEEGTGAVSHSDLLALLNKCSSVQDQIDTLVATLSLTNEDMQNRKEFCEYLSSAFKPYIQDCRVEQFGSSMNGLGFKGCDIDVCLRFLNTNDETPVEHIKLEVPSLEQVEEGLVDKSDVARMYPRYLLRFIRRILRRRCDGVREPIVFIRGRCPILRFYHEKYDLFCDMSIENKNSIRNTKLLRFICHLDSRIGSLMKALRYWGKHGKFIGDADMFNSYAFSLIIIYFLQNTTPPLIPPCNFIISAADYLKPSINICDDSTLFSSLKSIPPSQNMQSTEELLREFFFFYLLYDFSRVIQPLTNSSVLKQHFDTTLDPSDVFEFSTITLQDPFRLSFNSTGCISYKYSRRFLANLINSCRLYQQPNIWHLSQENWGLSSVIDSVLISDKTFEIKKKEEFELLLKSAEGSNESVDKLYSNAGRIIKKIFEKALFFECKDSHLRKISPGKLVLNLNCKVSYNTWSRRRLVEQDLLSDTPTLKDKQPLELENIISTTLLKETETIDSVFKFSCFCYGIIKNDRPTLKVCIAIESEKSSPVMCIFLREYLQKMLDKLL